MFHVELRQFPHVARAFNLSAEELEATILDAWVRGEVVELGERMWAPERAQLTIHEGRHLREDEIGMGRGWANATRGGEEVTDRLVGSAQRDARAGGVEASVAAFKQAVLDQCASGRIGVHQVLWLANSLHSGRRVSERLALAEQSVWELLHERRVTMLRAPQDAGDLEPVGTEQWRPTLLAWSSWAGVRGPSVLLEALPPLR